MNILITGGAGFIGSHLTERLLAEGHHVLVIDNYTTGRRDNLTLHPHLEVVEGSITDRDLVFEAFQEFRPDRVVHAAASYKDPDNWYDDAFTNGVGTVNVVQAARETGVERLIYFQTSLCYGLHPLEQPITLDHPLFSGGSDGGSSYAVSKTTGELYIALSGLDFFSFRLANVYGPRNLTGPLPTFYHRLTSGKPCFVMDARRDFIYVDDLVEVVMKALEGAGEPGYYHLASGSDHAIKELFEATVDALGLQLDEEVEVRPRGEDDVYTILLDPSKANRVFDWKTTTPLEEGIRKTIAYYEEYGIHETYTHLKLAAT